METQRGIYQLVSAIVLATILLFGSGLFFWKAGFFNRVNEPKCSKEYINLCSTEKQCEDVGLFRWDDVCHCNDPELDEELKDKEIVIEQTLPCGRDVCVQCGMCQLYARRKTNGNDR